MKASKFPFSQEFLSKILRYDQQSGDLFSLVSRGNLNRGDRIGYKNTDGYRRLKINDKLYSAQRIIWLLHYGVDPYGYEIDHINHNRSDNRLINLRLVDRATNSKNQTLHKTNTSGVSGVRFRRNSAKIREGWYAEIRLNGKKKHLGRFDIKQDAINARKSAEIKYNFHKNHGDAK